MKTLYIECHMGAAGDMLMASLLELCPNPAEFIEKMNSLNIPGVKVSQNSVVKCGIRGTKISVIIDGKEEREASHLEGHVHHHSNTHDLHEYGQENDHHHNQEQQITHHHQHSGMSDICVMVESLSVSDRVKSHALAIYDLIAEAESSVHGVPVADIHFHEVGSLDAVADIVGVCLLIEMLAPDQIIASPISMGSGQVQTAHGILPVPAPATAYILKGVPCYSGHIRGELCTPTGAALLKHFAISFSDMPLMKIDKIGYGMGKKDFEAANCVRTFWGETTSENEYQDKIVQICCNLDDMTPEAIAFAAQILFDSGALDVFSIPIIMKKSRSANMLVCLCHSDCAHEMALRMLKHTSTNGVRLLECSRYKLKAEYSLRKTSFGEVRIKKSSGYDINKIKPEYEDVVRCAKEHSVTYGTVYSAAVEMADIIDNED